LVSAITTQDAARAAILRAELGIRQAVLGVMGTQVESMAELTAISAQEERLLAGINVQSALSGANLGKARGEATVLAREIATGSVNARTMGALLGSLGPLLTTAGIGAFFVVKAIDKIADGILSSIKHVLDLETEFGKAQTKLVFMAKTARDLGDEVKLADAIQRELDRSAQEMAKFRADQISGWTSFANTVAHLLGTTRTPFEEAAGRAYADAIKQAQQHTRDLNIDLDLAKQSIVDWDNAQKDLPFGIDIYTQKVDQLTTKLNALDVKRHLNPSDASTVSAYQKTLTDLEDAKNKLQDLQKEQDQLNRAVAKEDRKDVTATLREEEALLQSIRQDQQLIQQNPFLSADEKSAASLRNYLAELQQLESEIQKLNALKGGPLDPAQLAQVNQRLQGANFEVQLLQLKMVGLQHPFTSELTNWVNSFGTTAQQAAHIVTDTLGTAINGVSSALTGLIFGTQNWRQAVEQAVESIVQNLIKVGLQMIIQRALGSAIRASAVTEATSTNTAIAASAAPAATLESAATFGSSAIVGEAAILAALAAVAGFVAHKGGLMPRRRMHSGGLAPDEVPIIAQEGEFMIQRSVMQQPGMLDLMMAVNSGMLFHRGGGIRRMHEGGETDFWFDEFGGFPMGHDPSIEPTPIPASTPSPPDPNVFINQWPPNLTPSMDIPFVQPPGLPNIDPEFDPDQYMFQGEYGRNFNPFGNFGYFAPPGTPGWLQGPTMLPTTFDPQGYPYAIPVFTNPTEPQGLLHPLGGSYPKAQHSGGIIGNRLHLGGSVGSLGRFPRLHSGGMAGSTRSTGAMAAARPSVSVYALTDIRQLSKMLASDKSHQKFVIDTISGRRIDLGI
jgi:hypothetical protein